MPSQEEIIQGLQQVRLFSRLSRQQLRRMVGLVREATYAPGETICVQGEPGRRYYILRSGQVRATRMDPEGRVAEVRRLGAGEAFGETSLLLGDVHDVTVEVVEPTTVWYLEREEFEKLLAAVPSIERALQMRPDVAERRRYPRFRWLKLEEGELLVKVLRRHWFSLVDRIFLSANLLLLLLFLGVLFLAVRQLSIALAIAGALLLAGSVVPLLSIGYHWIDWANDVYVVTNRRVAHHERAGALLTQESFSAAPLRAIQNVQVVQTGLAGRLLRFGDLIVETAGAAGQVVFHDIPDPWSVQNTIFEQRARVLALERLQTREEIRKVVRRHFLMEGGEEEVVTVAPPAPVRLGCLAWPGLILRYFFPPTWQQEGPVITWRRHPITLPRAILFPTVVGTGLTLLVGLIEQFVGHFILSLTALYGIVMLGVILWFFWNFEDWQNDYLQVTTTRLIQVDRLPLLLRESRREASLEQITNVRFEQGILGRLLGYGHIFVETAAPAGTFQFRYVARPQDVQREIFAHIEAARRRQQEEEARRRRQEMLEWLSAYDEVRRQREISGGPR